MPVFLERIEIFKKFKISQVGTDVGYHHLKSLWAVLRNKKMRTLRVKCFLILLAFSCCSSSRKVPSVSYMFAVCRPGPRVVVCRSLVSTATAQVVLISGIQLYSRDCSLLLGTIWDTTVGGTAEMFLVS